MSTFTLRPLRRTDLESVVELDAEIFGHSRRPYLERRLQSALAAPDLHVQLAAERDGALAGFVLARRLEGEFGRPELALRLETLGVAAAHTRAGAGRALIEALGREARRLDARELRTTALWTHHVMLRFLHRTGFVLAENQILECGVHTGRLVEDGDEESPERDTIDARTLTSADLPGILRVDRRLTGRDRGTYVRRKVEESLQDSGISVSLAAHEDGAIVGFVTARVDTGDAGRTEPVAILDTIGVDPAFARKGVGRGLMSQLFTNLHAICVERIETIVAREDFALLRFLYRIGFEPSQRLAFRLRVG